MEELVKGAGNGDRLVLVRFIDNFGVESLDFRSITVVMVDVHSMLNVLRTASSPLTMKVCTLLLRKFI